MVWCHQQRDTHTHVHTLIIFKPSLFVWHTLTHTRTHTPSLTQTYTHLLIRQEFEINSLKVHHGKCFNPVYRNSAALWGDLTSLLVHTHTHTHTRTQCPRYRWTPEPVMNLVLSGSCTDVSPVSIWGGAGLLRVAAWPVSPIMPPVTAARSINPHERDIVQKNQDDLFCYVTAECDCHMTLFHKTHRTWINVWKYSCGCVSVWNGCERM